jgi:hypothetical protein
LDDRLDIIATDHAPHTLEEKGVTRNAAGELTQAGAGPYEKPMQDCRWCSIHCC